MCLEYLHQPFHEGLGEGMFETAAVKEQKLCIFGFVSGNY